MRELGVENLMQIKAKDILNKILFTERDDDITGSSLRDPLGLQLIWSHYARKVIKHLTTISTDIRGFREVLLCLSICNKYKNSGSDMKYKDLILLFEQLFIYSTIEQKKSDGILGADNGTHIYYKNNENPLIDSEKTILVREISLGYYGRYKSPLVSMNIIDESSIVSNEINVPDIFGEKIYGEIYKAFVSFLGKTKTKRRYKDFKKSKKLCSKKLCELICGGVSEKEKKFWLKKLNIHGKDKNELMSKCYNLVTKERSCEKIFSEIDDENVKSIEKIELFLLCMEKVFYDLLECRKLEDYKIKSKKKYIDRYKEFSKIYNKEFGKIYNKDNNTIESDFLKKRMKFINEKLDPGNDDFIRNIYEYHKLVCKQKESAQWLEVDSKGNIETYIEPDVKIDNINEWRRDYYIGSLSSIKSGLGKKK